MINICLPALFYPFWLIQAADLFLLLIREIMSIASYIYFSLGSIQNQY